MKIFRTIESSSNLIKLLNTCRREGYFEQDFVDVTPYFTIPGDKPLLKKTKDGKYTSLLLQRYDGTTRFAGKGTDGWIMYEMYG